MDNKINEIMNELNDIANFKRFGEADKEFVENPVEAYEKLKAENERLQKLTCFNCGEETLSPSGAEIYSKILVYKQTLQEIKAIANINAVNTCWSILNKCDTCKEAKECGLQSPLEKLKTISGLITKVEGNR